MKASQASWMTGRRDSPWRSAILLLTIIAPVAVEARADTVVYPTGVFPDDVQNVQAAVNLGGVVRLKAVNVAGDFTPFNFGTAELLPGRRILLTTDVAIVGEQVGAHGTTIRGGLSPIRGLVPVQSKIQGIAFEGPLASAIVITASTGAEIIGNRVDGVVPLLEPLGFTFGDGIDVFTGGSGTTGTVRVAGNVIQNLTADCCAGIQFDGLGGVTAAVEITGNTINSVQSLGIAALRSDGPVLVADNSVAPGPGVAGAAILVDGNQGAAYVVRGNRVVCENPEADGIIVAGVFSDGSVAPLAEKNQITMHNSEFGGLSIYGSVTGALLGENKIEGDSAFALQISEGVDSTQLAISNRLQGNAISRVLASIADVRLGTNTRNNEVLGDCSSLIDLGVSNFVTCGALTTGNGRNGRAAGAHANKQRLLERLHAIAGTSPVGDN
jgi:hypothetical protein